MIIRPGSLSHPVPRRGCRSWLVMLVAVLAVLPLVRAAVPAPVFQTVALQCSAPAGISFDPQAEVVVALTVENVSPGPLALEKLVCRVARTRALPGNPGSIWDARYRNIEPLAEWPLASLLAGPAARLEPGQRTTVTVRVTPNKYGHFSILIADRAASPDTGYRAGAFAVVYPPAPGPRPDSYFLATSDDTMGQGETKDFGIPERYGIKWLRLALSPEFKPDGSFNWSRPDKLAAALRQHHLLALSDISQWNGPVPEIGGKPVTYFWGRKVNLIPAPADFPVFARQVAHQVKNYRDVMPAGYLRNEPWEKGSITFYHGTGKYYGEWLKTAFEAARSVTADFPILAADAITNFEDNIQMRGLTGLVDITSHHSDLEQDRGAVQSAALGKPAWETEDWLSHYDAYLVANLTMKTAHGYQKSNPGDPGLYQMLPGDDAHPDWRFVPHGPISLPAPGGHAISTWLHFIEDTRFIREINSGHLPWMFLFGQPESGTASGKHAAVVIGRIKAYGYEYHEKDGDVAWPAVTAFGRLLVADADRALTVYDFSGNPVARGSDGGYAIPLNEDAHYVVSTRGAEDVAAKLEAAEARYDGNGFQASMLDFTRPLAQRPPVRVTVRNCVQATADVEVRLAAPAGWRITDPRRTLPAMRPGESRELEFAVEESRELPGNRYPFTLEVASAAGTLRIEENLHVAIFQRGTVQVDGDLSDWEKIGALPVTVSGGLASADSVEKYWFPFLNLAATNSTTTQVRFAGAWDNDYFYLCAEVTDAAEQYRPSMEKGTYFTLHDPPLDFLYWGVTPQFISTAGDGLKIAFDMNRPGEKDDPWLPPKAQLQIDRRFSQLSADYEYDLYLGAENRLAEPYAVVRDRHLARLANPPDENYRKPRPPFEDPVFVNVGEPQPEVWRLMAPGVPRHNYYPYSPRRERDQGLVKGAQLVVKRVGASWRYEAAIPWSELAGVKPVAGREVRFSFYVLDDGKRVAGWAQGRSASGRRTQVLHPTWVRADAIETVWSFQDSTR